MQSIRANFLPIVLGALSLLAACDGGNGDGGLARGGASEAGISFGTVTDLGSIILNGNHIDDSAAAVTLDDNPGAGPHGGLKRGMVVQVSGVFSGNTGTASNIEFRDNLEGVVCAITPGVGITTLRVLGQTVIVDATTIVDNNAVIGIGDIVEVSGLPDAQERIHASFVEKKTPATAAIEVKGRVDTVLTNTLIINALEVDFTTALIDNNIPSGQPAVGQFVEVKGAVFACGGSTDTLMATKVELEAEGAGALPAGARAEIEGFITLNPLRIGNQQVATTGDTLFLPEDFSADDLVLGAKVEAEGTLQNGILTATKISFRQNVKLESDVAGGDNSAFTLVGLPGITVKTDANTDFNGVTVTSGAHLRVRGIEGPNNTVLATRIESQGGSTVFLQGTVDTVADPLITLLGVTVNTAPIQQFEDVNDNLISRAAFFGLVQPGTFIKIKGQLVDTVPVWDEAELED